MRTDVKAFGFTRDGRQVHSYTLTQDNGTFCTLLSYGATLQRLMMPDRDGLIQDIVLGYETLEEYEKTGNPYFGATIGRYANRINQARFKLDGTVYQLAKNDGDHHLHGGLRGFDKVVWRGEAYISDAGPSVRFFYYSEDGQENYPGNLDAQVTFTLTADQRLILQYTAVADQTTIINLTNHSYFNLAGQGSGSILNHQLKLAADHYTEITPECIPTGEIKPVSGTALDFREMKAIGQDIERNEATLVAGQGYDHNFVLRDTSDRLHPCAEVHEPHHGRIMTVETTLPGVQLYTGNMMQPDHGKEGVRYDRRDALCLETQLFPDSPNHSHFPSAVFEAGQPFHHQTVYRFKTDRD